MSSRINESQGTYISKASKNERYYIRFGWLTIVIGILGFLGWAALTPLDKGVSSSGSVIVSGHRKTVQSPVNGIINSIKVKEGDSVEAGEVLVQLSQTQAQTQLNAIRDRYYTTLASALRLHAEHQGSDNIVLSPELESVQDQPRVAEIIMLQNQLFTSRRQGLKSEIDGYKQSIAGIRDQLKGSLDSRINKKIQLATLHEQMKNMKQLANEGYLPRNRYLDIQRQFAEVSSSIDETQGRIGQLQKQLIETQKKIEQRSADYQREVRTQLAQTQMESLEYKNKLEMADFELVNTAIVAPVDGTVVGLSIFTQGGVVAQGDHLMEIVPSQTPLMVDARLKVDLIDKVYNGLPVDLMFTAFNQNKTPKVSGTVTLISADRLVDKTSGEPYYQMQITVSPEDMKLLHGNDIRPGMPVEVFVKTGERSLLSYLFKPIFDRVHTSMTEE